MSSFSIDGLDFGSSRGSSLKGSADGALPFFVSFGRGAGGLVVAGASTGLKQRPDEQLPDEKPLKLQLLVGRLPESQQPESQQPESQQPVSQQLEAAHLLSQLAGQNPSLTLMQPDIGKAIDANNSAHAK